MWKAGEKLNSAISIIIIIVGLIIIGQSINWWLALGIFLVVWGNNGLLQTTRSEDIKTGLLRHLLDHH